MVTKWFIEVSAGLGATEYYVEDFQDYESAQDWAEEACKDLMSDYGYDNDPDHFGGCYDTYGKDWDEDLQDYRDIVDLKYSVVEYDPEEHEEYL